MTIAKVQYQILTARVRRFRVLFFCIITALLLLWGFFGAPVIVAGFVPDLQAMGGLLKPYIGGLFDYIFLLVFGFFIIYQLSAAFQNIEEGQHELLLATPIKEGDIFLGEYLGKMPIFLWGILFILPLLTSVLQSLFPITPLDIGIITFLVFGLIAVAAWIGSIITGYAVKRLSRSPRGKDIGKALTFLLAAILLISYYSVSLLGQQAISSPIFRAWLQISPSSWFSNVLNSIIGVSLPLPWFSGSLSLVSIVIFTTLIFLGGYRLAPHFYSFDIGGSQEQVSIVRENGYFRFIRNFLPRKWENLVVTQMKNFIRRRENLSKLAYVIIITVFLAVFEKFSSGGQLADFPFLDLTFTPWMLEVFLGMMLGGYIFVHSKEILWIYKQSPRDIKALVFANFIAMIFLSFPIVLGFSIYIAISSGLDVFQAIVMLAILELGSAFSLGMSIGISCLNPAYKEKSGKLMLNVMIYIGIQFVIFLAVGITAIFQIVAQVNGIQSLLFVAFLMSLAACVIGSLLLYLGIYRLEKIE